MQKPSKALAAIKKSIAKEFVKTKARIVREKKRKKSSILEKGYLLERIERELRETIRELYALDRVLPLRLDEPPGHVPADISVPCFDIAKIVAESPTAVAGALAKAILIGSGTLIAAAEAAGPFVNISLSRGESFGEVLAAVELAKERYGRSAAYHGEVALIDYSHPNIAKPIGVGHLRSTIIGESLARIYEAVGFSVIRDNYLGDWGTQFGKLMYAYERWGRDAEIKKDPVVELKNLYVRFHEEAKKNPLIEDEARALAQKLEVGDKRLGKLWLKFRDWSIKDYARVYALLRVSFDIMGGESFVIDRIPAVLADAKERGLARTDPETGAMVVENLDGLPSFLLQKKDDATLYMSRDLAMIRFRVELFSLARILYVVGDEQTLHFRQLFALAEKLGYLKDTKPEHIAFGLLFLGGKKMSTRRGTLVELDELIEESVEKAKEIMTEKSAALRGRELLRAAEIIGIGAVIYNDLRQSRTTNISFSWEKMLNFETGSAAYLQYTAVRIASILGKVDGRRRLPKNPQFEYPIEFELAKKIAFFPRAIERAQEENAPHYIALYLEELAQIFNSFYQSISVQKTEDDNLKNSRLALIRAVRIVIENGLALLNICVPKKM